MKKLISPVLLLFATFAIMGARTTSASAQQFASIQPDASSTSSAFVFTNSGSSSTFDGSDAVDFTYVVPNGTSIVNSPIAGTMTLTSGVSGTATSFSLAGQTFIEQPLSNISIVFTDPTPPVAGETDLLTVTDVSGMLLTNTTSASTIITLASDSGITYSSDYLSFPTNVGDDLSISLSGYDNSAGNHFTVLKIGPDGYLSSSPSSNGSFYTGLGSGGFDGPAAVPEPSSLATVGALVLGLGLLCFLQIKRTGRHSA